MKTTLYTANRKITDNLETVSLYLPGEQGDFQILDNHIPVISSLTKGNVIIKTASGKVISVQANYGYVQFAHNEAKVVIQDTTLTEKELVALQKKAETMSTTEIRKDEAITEDEFFHREQGKEY
jgi:F-type H+-transporting ATPase subunit epsilon